MPGLSGSRWASGNSRSSAVSSTTIATITHNPTSPTSSASELKRYRQIFRRLVWKLPFLAEAYQKATDRLGPSADPTVVAEAEMMFKLDFFEYYMLCERALVHLQGIFGIAISRGEGNGTAEHRYHANVLQALDSEDHPLHDMLGVGEARRQLARAKDLRNRWKNAEEGSEWWHGKMEGPLESYDLENMLSTIFAALNAALAVAEQFVAEGKKTTGEGQDTDMGMGSDGEQWEFMMDAMDWESI